jgi:cytochrome b561
MTAGADLPARWHPAIVTLHWLTLLAIALQFLLAMLMTDETRNLVLRFELYQLHKSVGLTLAAFVLLRLALRLALVAPAPSRPEPWQRFAANAVHGALYLCVIALPATGVLMVSSAPIQVPTLYFGWFAVPHPIGPDKPTYELMRALHQRAFDLLIVLGLIHLGAVLFHHLVWHDRLLRRMWFRG